MRKLLILVFSILLISCTSSATVNVTNFADIYHDKRYTPDVNVTLDGETKVIWFSKTEQWILEWTSFGDYNVNLTATLDMGTHHLSNSGLYQTEFYVSDGDEKDITILDVPGWVW